MASRLNRFRGWTQKTFGPSGFPTGRRTWEAKPGFVQLEDRSVPATFVVTNILDNQVDVVGGYSLRQAILAANANPGFDRIEFNIPRSPSLPQLSDGQNYFPIVLATKLPDLTDPAGVSIDATTQQRPKLADPTDPTGQTLIEDTRLLIQLLPDPNPGAFPDETAFFVSGRNNFIRGFVITGFPGSGITVAGGSDNIIVGNYLNTDITGTKVWRDDPIYASARGGRNLPDEESNASGAIVGGYPLTPRPVLAGVTLLGSGTDGPGATDNVIGGMFRQHALALTAADGRGRGAG